MAAFPFDRRRRERLALQCRVSLNRNGRDHAPQGKTLNLSSQGFYWISDVAFAPGEKLHCWIWMPATGFRFRDARVCLECEAQVVRMEETLIGFGMGCRIEKYVFSASGDETPSALAHETANGQN
jgi:hypothetical protein